jgi:hypothetical protein
MPDTRELAKIETQLADNRKVIKRLGGVLGVEFGLRVVGAPRSPSEILRWHGSAELTWRALQHADSPP